MELRLSKNFLSWEIVLQVMDMCFPPNAVTQQAVKAPCKVTQNSQGLLIKYIEQAYNRI